MRYGLTTQALIASTIAIAPTIGLWVFEHGGWRALNVEAMALNLVMAAIAWHLPSDRTGGGALPDRLHHMVEWRVLILGVTLFLYAFSYGGITSFAAVYAEQLQIAPKAIYFTTFALTIMATRPFIARPPPPPGRARPA